MDKYLTELVGTFFLVLTIGLSVTTGSDLVAVAVGTVLTALVYMGYHVSGAHYNPAITLAILLRGLIEPAEAVRYVVFQITGAILACFLTVYLSGTALIMMPRVGVSALQAVVVEAMLTLVLALVILQVAANEKTKGNSYYGIAIGFTVLAITVAGSGISGGAFNPAVGLGPAIVDAVTGGTSIVHVWIYIVGPFAGAALATLVYKLQEV